MSALPSIAHLSPQTWLAIGAVVILLGLLLVVRLTRARTIVVSAATAEMMVYHLSRIADALDRSALERAAQHGPQWREEAPAARAAETPVAQARDARQVGLSMFGR